MDDLPLIDQRSLSSSNNVTLEVNKDVRELTLFWEHFLNTKNEKQRVSFRALHTFALALEIIIIIYC